MLKENAVIVDVCSVKEYPVQWMRELLPANVSILATHPMFGPDSAADSFTAAFESEEGSEGTMAFIQKRKPSWAIDSAAEGGDNA